MRSKSSTQNSPKPRTQIWSKSRPRIRPNGVPRIHPNHVPRFHPNHVPRFHLNHVTEFCQFGVTFFGKCSPLQTASWTKFSMRKCVTFSRIQKKKRTAPGLGSLKFNRKCAARWHQSWTTIEPKMERQIGPKLERKIGDKMEPKTETKWSQKRHQFRCPH